MFFVEFSLTRQIALLCEVTIDFIGKFFLFFHPHLRIKSNASAYMSRHLHIKSKTSAYRVPIGDYNYLQCGLTIDVVDLPKSP